MTTQLTQPTNNGDFWSKAGPGLLDFGVGIYNRKQAEQEAAERLKRARGSLYNTQTAGAQNVLTQAGGFDPRAHAAERFQAQQDLLKPVQDKEQADLMRNLYAKGMLGISNYNPGVEGITPNGTAMNPHMAAFFAAQNAQRAKSANESLKSGEDYLDNLLKRSGMLQKQAGDVQKVGIEAEKLIPSRAASNAQMIKGAMSVAKDSGLLNEVFKPGGLFGQGVDWLGKTTGWWDTAAPKWDLASASDFGNWEWL